MRLYSLVFFGGVFTLIMNGSTLIKDIIDTESTFLIAVIIGLITGAFAYIISKSKYLKSREVQLFVGVSVMVVVFAINVVITYLLY